MIEVPEFILLAKLLRNISDRKWLFKRIYSIFFWKLFLIKIFIERISRVALNPLDIKLKFFYLKEETLVSLVGIPARLFQLTF